MDSLFVLQWTTFTATVFMILSGIPPSYEMYKSKDSSKAPVLFFLLSIANGIGWTHYGFLVGNFNLLVLNSLSLVLNSACVLVYIAYTPRLTRLWQQAGVLAAYFSCLYGHLYLRAGPQQFLQHLGASCSFVNVVFLLLPLLDIVSLLRTRDLSGVHLPIQLAACLCTSLWTAYGTALADWNVVVPNLLGAVLAAAGLAARGFVQFSAASSRVKSE